METTDKNVLKVAIPVGTSVIAGMAMGPTHTGEAGALMVATCFGTALYYHRKDIAGGVSQAFKAMHFPVSLPSSVVPAKRKPLGDGPLPTLNDVVGKGVLFLGVRGSGKTNALAVFLEAILQEPIPALICDLKQEFISLPDVVSNCFLVGSAEWAHRYSEGTYYGLDPENAYQFGYRIMETGGRFIFLPTSYGINKGCEVLMEVIHGMTVWADEQSVGKKAPALIAIDEAQQFMHQASGGMVSKEVNEEMVNCFSETISVGRTRGMTPIIATQRPAEIDKRVINGCELDYFMKQTSPSDIKYYAEYLSDKDLAGTAKSLKPGESIRLFDGVTKNVMFPMRRSVHTGVTPSIEDARRLYGDKTVVLTDLSPSMPPLPMLPTRTTDELRPSLPALPITPAVDRGPSLEDGIRSAFNQGIVQKTKVVDHLNANGFSTSRHKQDFINAYGAIAGEYAEN